MTLIVPLKYAITPWNTKHFVHVEIQDEHLWVDSHVHSDIQLIEKIKRQFSSRDNDLAFVPYWPGAYAILRKISPIWEIYGVVSRSKKFQDQEVALLRLNEPKAILVWNYSLDGREDLQYRHTHELMYKFIRTHFREERSFAEGRPYELYLRN